MNINITDTLFKMNLEESDCCGASPLWESDICSDCGEHAEFNNTDKDLV